MKKNSSDLIKSMLGETFLEDLAKFDMVNIKTDTVISHEELADAYKVVPRAVMTWLISVLTPMMQGDSQDIDLPFERTAGAKMSVTKIANDVYSGEFYKDGKKLGRFMYRSIPGIGLVLLTAFELYDIDNLIAPSNGHAQAPVVEDKKDTNPDLYQQVGKMIAERMALKNLIDQGVDNKMAQRDAVEKLFLLRMSDEVRKQKEETAVEDEPKAAPAEAPKKELKLGNFLKNKKEKFFKITMAKSEVIQCPDCGFDIFNETGFSGCVCYGEDRKSKITLIKTEDGVKISFSKNWDKENILMLLKVLQGRRQK